MVIQRRGWLLRVGQLACLGFMGVLGLLDTRAWESGGPGRPPPHSALIHSAQIVLTLATVAVWLPAYRAGSRRLPALVIALSMASLALTEIVVGATLASDTEPMSSWGVSEAAGMFLVLLVAARRGRPADTIGAGILAVLALVAQPLRSDLHIGPILGLLQAMIAVCVLGVGVYLRHLANVRARRLARTRAEQRSEFARDLHDFIAHHVTGIVVQAQGARLIAERDPARAATALEQIERAGAEAMSAMRRMVGVLREPGGDAPLAPLKDIADLEPLVAGFTAAGGPPVRLVVDGSLDRLPVHVTTSAHRVVMEALTNVRQHATGATAVDVSIRQTPDWLLLTVSDDAPPAHRAGLGRERPGFGLVGLTERVQAAGGQLSAGPGITRGWTVDARLPLREVTGP